MASRKRRYMIFEDGDPPPHCISELGANGEEVELIFSDENVAKEYAERYNPQAKVFEIVITPQVTITALYKCPLCGDTLNREDPKCFKCNADVDWEI